MTGAFVIFIAMVIVGILLYVTDVTYFRHHHSVDSGERDPASSEEPSLEAKGENEVCCGMHLVCEKTSLSITDVEVIYYDDEELDRFSGRTPDSYSPEETEEFRDVLLTLLPQDVAGWAKSITLRKIELPADVKEELLMIVSETRANLLSQ